MQLLRRLQTFADEPFYSYAIRLAKENETNVKDVYQICGLTYRNFHPNILFEEDVAKGELLEKLGNEIVESSNFMYQTTQGYTRIYTVDFLGMTLANHYFNKGKVKVCPFCVHENKYLNSIWQLVHVTSCTHHKCLLVDKCNNCNNPLSWHAGILEGCRCSARWDQLFPFSKFIDSEIELTLGYLIHSKLFNSKCVISQHYCKQLFELSYEELTFLLSLIAWVLPSTLPFWSMNYIEQENNEATHLLLLEAMGIFTSWPLKFHSFIALIEKESKYRKSNIKSRRDEGKEKYRSLTSEFNKKLYSQASLQFAKDEFEKYKNCYFNMRIGPRVEQIKSRSFKGEVWLNNSIETVLINKKTFFSSQEASSVLGIHDEAVVNLSKQQIIKAIGGPGIDASLHWKFDVASVITILDAFEKNVVRHPNLREKDIINFRAAASSPMVGGYVPNMRKIITKVLSGVLLPCDIDTQKSGLNKFTFRKIDLVHAFTEELKQFNNGAYTVKIAAKDLNLSRNRLTYFMKKGFVKSEFNSQGCTVIKAQELVRFRNSYVLTTEIIEKVGIRRFDIIMWLKVRGINPLNNEIDDKHHQYLFLRDKNLVKLLME